jgi:hypothetical protein
LSLFGEEAVSPDEFAKLPQAERERLESRAAAYQEEVREALRQLPSWARERRGRLRELRGEATSSAVEHLIDELRRKYQDLPRVVAHLDAVRRDVIEHVEDFTESEASLQEKVLQSLRHPLDGRSLACGGIVNVIVDNAGCRNPESRTKTRPTKPLRQDRAPDAVALW